MRFEDRNEKGRVLERAVHALERAILAHSPGYSERTFRFEPRKILLRNGVRHEIDLYVSIEITPLHSVVYVFECKNWMKPVGKKEIVDFADKIAVADAQRGFFIAKAFTRDAIAQAATDSRIELLIADEPELEDIRRTVGEYQDIIINPTAPDKVELFQNPGQRIGTPDVNDAFTTSVHIDGQPKPMVEWLCELGHAALQQAVLREDTAALSTGRYASTFQATFTLEDRLVTVNGTRFLSIYLEGHGSFDVIQPQIKSSFDVEKRGRFVHLVSSFDDFTCEHEIASGSKEGRKIRHVWARH
jgi:hypothetical protein